MTSRSKLTIFTAGFIIFVFSLILLSYFGNFISQAIFKSLTLAAAITTLNALIGFISIRSGIDKPEKIFMRRVFGGMIFRLFSTLIVVVLALVLLELNKISFIFSILFFYIFYLIIEIIYLNFRQI